MGFTACNWTEPPPSPHPPEVSGGRPSPHLQPPRARHVPAAELLAVADDGEALPELAAAAENELNGHEVWIGID